MTVLGFAYVGLHTPDPAALSSFYRELLDAAPVTGTHEQLQVGSAVLGFWQAAAPGGEQSTGFLVDEQGLEAFVARAGDLGLPVERTSYNAWSRGASVRDPEGRVVEALVNDLAVFWTNE